MERGTTLFLRLVIFLIGITVLVACIFLLPSLASKTADLNPEFAYLQYPVLIGLFVTTIPFFYALYQAFKLLNYIDRHNAFSILSVKALKYIAYCAIIISLLYVIGGIFLFFQNALHPGIGIIGLTIIFTSVVIAVFATVLQNLLQSALEIKSENDLTI